MAMGYQQWLDVQKLQGNTDGYRVFLKADTATYVDVTAATWQGDAYVNVALQVSPLFRRAGAVKGLMGNWDGVQQREESDPASLAKAWQLDLANNLFTCNGAAACGAMVSPVGPSDAEAASVAASKGLLAQGFTPYVVTQKRAFQPVITPIKKLRMRRAAGSSRSRGPSRDADQAQTQTRAGGRHAARAAALSPGDARVHPALRREYVAGACSYLWTRTAWATASTAAGCCRVVGPAPEAWRADGHVGRNPGVDVKVTIRA
ncbi:hypothetical protein PINS_up009737 [Pythium insidiosum]|nr:hypothetical protein PINS_up009737 [Pythium insidiosum]